MVKWQTLRERERESFEPTTFDRESIRTDRRNKWPSGLIKSFSEWRDEFGQFWNFFLSFFRYGHHSKFSGKNSQSKIFLQNRFFGYSLISCPISRYKAITVQLIVVDVKRRHEDVCNPCRFPDYERRKKSNAKLIAKNVAGKKID